MKTSEDLELLRVLGDLVARNRRAQACYRYAIDRLGGDGEGDLTRFMEEHARQAAHVTLLLHTLGGRTPDAPPKDETAPDVTPGVDAPPEGTAPREVLLHLRYEEVEVSRAYLDALSHPMSAWLHAIMERGLATELQHTARLEERLVRAA